MSIKHPLSPVSQLGDNDQPHHKKPCVLPSGISFAPAKFPSLEQMIRAITSGETSLANEGKTFINSVQASCYQLPRYKSGVETQVLASQLSQSQLSQHNSSQFLPSPSPHELESLPNLMTTPSPPPTSQPPHTYTIKPPPSQSLPTSPSSSSSYAKYPLPRQLSPSPHISTHTYKSTYTYSSETQAAADAYLLFEDNSFENKSIDHNLEKEHLETPFRWEEKRWDLCKGAGCGLLGCAMWCLCGRARKRKWMSSGCDGEVCEGMDEVRESVENDDDYEEVDKDSGERIDIDVNVDIERNAEETSNEGSASEEEEEEVLSEQPILRLANESKSKRNCGGGGCGQPQCDACWCQCGLKASNRGQNCYGFHPEKEGGSESDEGEEESEDEEEDEEDEEETSEHEEEKDDGYDE